MPMSLERLLIPLLTVPGKKKIKSQLSSTAGTNATFPGVLSMPDESHFQDAEVKKVLAYYKSSPPFPSSFSTGDNVLVLHPLGAVSGCNLLSL